MLRAAVVSALLLAAPGARAASTGTLVVCDDVQDPPSLNPFQIFSEKTLTLVQQVVEGLVRFDAEGRIEPALAKSWERVDEKRMRFHLRPGVLFHDGEPFDARAVKFSLDRYLAPETHYPGIGFIETISGVEIVDPLTVDVLTNRPDGLLLNRLAFVGHIVPPEYFRKEGDAGFAERPVGTGPFRFESWKKGREVALAAYPGYWMKDFPKAERLVFRFLPVERQVAALLGGDIDILTNLPGTRTLEVQRSSDAFVTKRTTFYTVVGNFNTSRAPLADKRVREAIDIAIDREALVRYDLLGNGEPIGTISLPGEFGHDDGVAPYRYDPDRARLLLKQAGHAGGLTLKLLLKVNAARAGQIIAKQLKKVGITLAPTMMTDAQIFELMKDRSQWDMLIADCPDPMLHAFFIRNIFLGGKSPFSLSAVPEIDERLDKLVAALAPDKQEAISKELDRFVHDEFLAVPTYRTVRTFGLRRGVVFTPAISGMPHFFEAIPVRPHVKAP